MSGSRGLGVWAAVAAAAVALAVGVVVVLNTGSGEPDVTPAGEEPTPAGETVAHVHGLGVDAEDGTLHVATHHGLFRLAGDGTAVRVSNDPHDFMGFTVVGPRHFLASGHPAPGTAAARELERPHFGLIESTDGGATWTAKSLSGEVDFHALEAAHGNVYGLDATTNRFMVSSDGIEWETRSSVSMADLAVDPDDADHLVAASPQGLIESIDGGRTWTLVQDAPRMVFLDWHAERGLWGLDGEGRLHHSAGNGWQHRGALRGAPQALLAHGTGVYAAVDDGSTVIYRVRDGQAPEVIFRDRATS